VALIAACDDGRADTQFSETRCEPKNKNALAGAADREIADADDRKRKGLLPGKGPRFARVQENEIKRLQRRKTGGEDPCGNG